VQERRRIAEGREAEIFAWGEGAVLKLYRGEGYGYALEAAALETLGREQAPAPRLIDRVEVDGRPGLVIERIEGRDMLTLLERTPWKLVSYARRLAETHAAIHRVTAPEALPRLEEVLRSRIAAADLPEHLRSFALEHAAALPAGDRLCHGDFHPANVLVTAEGLSVIDWPLASRGEPTVDFARSALLMSMGDPMAPSPLMRVLLKVGRRTFARVYESTYRRRSPVDAAAMRHAGIAHIAARVLEGIPVEVPMLIGMLERAASERV
jgi:aminoglycoside phosphotransferase (APT) family kinase protein